VDYLGHVRGGLPFLIQPSVRITDRGGNLVKSVESGNVVVSMVRQPHGYSSELLPASQLTASFAGGVATFEGLYINKAGGPYQLAFATDLVC
jgi:hypothetical protein